MSEENNDPLSLSNLIRPEIRANPYPLYRQIRETDPVHWDEARGFWTVTRYADIITTLRDSRFSKAKGITAAFHRIPESERKTAEPVYHMFSKQMLFADEPYHTQLRRLVNKAFTPRIVSRMQEHIQQIVDELLDAVQDTGEMDVIRQFAYPLPITVITEMLGLPQQDRAQFKQWSDDFMAILGVVRQEPKLIQKARQSLIQFSDYLGHMQEEYHRHPKDDLLGALFTVEEEGQMLDHEELVANSLLLLAAGHETTTNLIGNGLLALLNHPNQMKQLKNDSLLTNIAVEEFMRYDNPVQILFRIADEDLEIGDKIIRQGQLVNLIIGAANRDSEQFSDPDHLDFGRPEIRHMGLGFGIHFCVGAALARMEAQIAFNTLLERLPELRLANGTLEWQSENPIFRGLKALPVVFN